MQMAEMIAMITVMITLACGVVLIVRALLDHLRRTKSERLQSEVYNKMLDKMGNSQEVLAWMETEAGKNLFQAPAAERPAPYTRILNSVQYGIIAIVLGGGIMGAGSLLRGSDQEPAFVIGTLVMSLGAGMLLAAGGSYALSKKFGLINGGVAKE